MQAVIAERPGPLRDVLTVRRRQEPRTLAAGEVAVRMRASTVNPSDAVTVSGAYRSRIEFPFVPGYEGVGVIERLGPDAPATALGTRVLPIGSAGTWQEVLRTRHEWCIPVPQDIPDEAACFAYINPLTALLLTERCGAGPSGVVAVTAATSAIAGQLAELLSLQGIRPLGLHRGTSGARVPHPELWGAVLDTSSPEWEQHLRHESGSRGIDVVLDCVGGAIGGRLWHEVRPGGTFLRYGLLSGQPLPAECYSGAEARRTEMIRLRERIHGLPRAQLPELFSPVFDHLRAGRLRTRIRDEVPLGRLPHALTPATRSPGKLLIRFPD